MSLFGVLASLRGTSGRPIFIVNGSPRFITQRANRVSSSSVIRKLGLPFKGSTWIFLMARRSCEASPLPPELVKRC
jgi:hypothetical protein